VLVRRGNGPPSPALDRHRPWRLPVPELPARDRGGAWSCDAHAL